MERIASDVMERIASLKWNESRTHYGNYKRVFDQTYYQLEITNETQDTNWPTRRNWQELVMNRSEWRSKGEAYI